MIFNLPNINGMIIETGILATKYDENTHTKQILQKEYNFCQRT